MSAGTQLGFRGKVTLGATTILGIGNWNMPGINTNFVDDSEFGDKWDSFQPATKAGGTITMAGVFKPADTTGQDALDDAQVNATEITNIRFYYNLTSYYEPCQTTYWRTAADSTGNDTQLSGVYVEAITRTLDRADVGRIDFTLRVNGVMVQAN